MAWGFRKSVSFGPFRLNASRAGLGMSFGVKGARISAGPQGTYVNLSSNGFYYRKRIDVPDHNNNRFRNETLPSLPPVQVTNGLHTITTTNFDNLTDVDSQDFINELESKCNRIALLPWLGVVPSVALYLFLLFYLGQVVRKEENFDDVFRITHTGANIRSIPSKDGKSLAIATQGTALKLASTDSASWWHVYVPYTEESGYVHHSLGQRERLLASTIVIRRFQDSPILTKVLLMLPIIPIIVLLIWLHRVDKRRKTLEINYQMDESVEVLYKKFKEYFSEFASSRRIWQKLHAQQNNDWKHNAGAGQLVRRAPVFRISMDQKPTPFLITNVSIPYIGLSGNALYFFPERIVMKRGNKFAALQYKNINIDHTLTRFIEDEAVPADTEVIGYTWKYVNRNGGPDKRFKDNRQIPICNYSEYHLNADNGLNEVITTSRVGAMDKLTEFIGVIGRFQGNISSHREDAKTRGLT